MTGTPAPQPEPVTQDDAIEWATEGVKQNIAERDAARAELQLFVKADMEWQDEMTALEDERDALRAFAQALFDDWPNSLGVDGFDLQDIAQKHGLLCPQIVTTPCKDEGCNCLDYNGGAEAMSDGVICYRKTKLLTGIAAQAGERT